jgi:hypothetical protein
VSARCAAGYITMPAAVAADMEHACRGLDRARISATIAVRQEDRMAQKIMLHVDEHVAAAVATDAKQKS